MPVAIMQRPTAPRAARAPQRIAKLLARAGVASRREVERMIAEGRVAVNGAAIDTPATLLASLHGVTVDGQPVAQPAPARLFVYHKPPGLLVTERDPAGRPTIYDRLPGDLPRVVPVGRLDLNTEGLLLLTTDGGLKRQLELPASGVERTYRARAYGEISQETLEGLMDGIEIEGIRYGPIDANMERRTGANVWIELTLTEGKNREVRRVLEHLGLQVSRLIRVRYGPFVLADLPAGEVGEIRQHDLVAFRKALALPPAQRRFEAVLPAARTSDEAPTREAGDARPARPAAPGRARRGSAPDDSGQKAMARPPRGRTGEGPPPGKTARRPAPPREGERRDPAQARPARGDGAAAGRPARTTRPGPAGDGERRRAPPGHARRDDEAADRCAPTRTRSARDGETRQPPRPPRRDEGASDARAARPGRAADQRDSRRTARTRVARGDDAAPIAKPARAARARRFREEGASDQPAARVSGKLSTRPSSATPPGGKPRKPGTDRRDGEPARPASRRPRDGAPPRPRKPRA